MKIWKTALLSLTATIGLTASPALSADRVNASIAADLNKPGATIEPEIQGQFAEHLGRGIYEGIWVGEDSPIPNTNGYRNDVLAALKELKVPMIRWPGGCFADEYNWRDGIGPRSERPSRINTHWGGVIDDNRFGTHEFLNYSEMVGAENYVAGNMGSGTPREMAEWLEYMTGSKPTTLVKERQANGRDKPWKVKYFGVGNESWGCGGNMRPEYSADLHRRYATFVKAQPGEKIIKVATGANVDDYNFTEVLMREAVNQMDAISIHYYTFVGDWDHKGSAIGGNSQDWADTLSNALHMDELITKHAAIMDKYDPEKRVGLYVDEWGTWYDQEKGSTPGFLYQQNTLRDAEVAALTLNIFQRHTDRVKLAAIAQMVNVLQAMILTDGDKMLLTPTYHVFNMYKPFQGATPLPLTINSPRYVEGDKDLPMVDASLARGTDGKLYLSLVNLSPDTSVKLATGLKGSAKGQILTGPKLDTHNTFDAPNTIKPAAFSTKPGSDGTLTFDLPAKSVVVVAIS